MDLIAEFKDRNDDLILHWGVGKRTQGEWLAADDKYLPEETRKWGDGKACQTRFIPDKSQPDYR